MKPGTEVYVSNESEEAALRGENCGIFLEELGHPDEVNHAFVCWISQEGLDDVKYAVPIPIDKEAEQVRFEAWKVREEKYPSLHRDFDGKYTEPDTRLQWESWLAAKEDVATEMSELREELKKARADLNKALENGHIP